MISISNVIKIVLSLYVIISFGQSIKMRHSIDKFKGEKTPKSVYVITWLIMSATGSAVVIGIVSLIDFILGGM